ncbi:MAG: 6,7-dimethyl-8-ribityllumazine synthase [Muribaculum sp.]|nr:6,7-dimethyl-8-ribityllumazine synthase [Muribaculaceae bacterium]MCM1080231.1 6,7-dimethyl-8-ribityllumazine synthase [Muribaculum sp.]
MSTALTQSAPSGSLPKLKAGKKVAVVKTLWNATVTDALCEGAVGLLAKEGVEYEVFAVPGAVELTYAAARLIRSYDAVIVLGCVIRGGTPHFDYVCQSVTQGTTQLNATAVAPVVFGVLTVDALDDALDRAGGKLGNKGTEAAEAAIHMIDFTDNL